MRQCTVCWQTFSGTEFHAMLAIVAHVKGHAATIVVHRCDVCLELYPDKESLTDHLQNHVITYKLHKCVICEEGCPNLKSLRAHLRSHVKA